jgi:hypothetical protein
MKLRETISWLRGTLPRQLFPRREECGERPLTDKEQQLISILALGQLEQFVAPSLPQRFGRKRPDRRARGRALVAQAVYNHPFTCSTPEAGRTSRGVQRLGGYGLWGPDPLRVRLLPGLGGILYWYALEPFHHWVYRGMFTAMARAVGKPILAGPEPVTARKRKPGGN